jgi:hypothetical protein
MRKAMTMNELLDFVLVVFTINCVLNILVLAYFRMVIKEEKELDKLFREICELFKKEKGKDGLE